MSRITDHRTGRTAPDRPVQQLAMWLDIMAGEVATARAVLAERIARAADGSGNGGSSERVQTSRGSSTTETRAMAVLHHDGQLAELVDRVDGIRIAIRSTRHWINTEVLRGQDMPAEPAGPTPCHDGQHGKAGVIEWGDPTCAWPADKAGLCVKHYQAWYRHRKNHGIDTSADFAA
jgi:hypothetical protein